MAAGFLRTETGRKTVTKINGKAAGKILAAAAVLAAFIVLAFLLSRHSAYYNPYRLAGGDTITFEKARVASVISEDVRRDEKHRDLLAGSQNITVLILTGKYSGKRYDVVNNLNYDTNYYLKPGQTIIVSVSTAENGKSVSVGVNSPDRAPGLCLLAAVFLALLCAAGGVRGLRSLGAIAFTVTGVLFIFIPLLYRGVSPEAAALALAAAVSCVSLVMTSGAESKSAVAILGTFGGCAVAAGLELAVSALTGASGYTLGDTDSLLAISSHSGLKVGGLLFAAVLISSLGAVMDISISVASAVAEVYETDPGANGRRLFTAGMNVGRDMMGTMANTLILAFVGSFLVPLIQIYTYNMPYLQVINSNEITTEILQALTGCTAAVSTVPLVSFLSAKLLPVLRRPLGGNTPDGKLR